jgi:hypothetical protein
LAIRKIKVDRHNQSFNEETFIKSDLKNSSRRRYADMHQGEVRTFVKDLNMKVQGFSTGENFYPSNGNSSKGIQGISYN